MNQPLLTIEVCVELDVVLARQRARDVAALLGFDAQDQTRIGTAVSELARNAFRYAGGGRVEFFVAGGAAASLQIRVCDQGPGIADLRAVLEGRHVSTTGMGLGIIGVRRLMDGFEIQSEPGKGTTVEIRKSLPRPLPGAKSPNLGRIADQLQQRKPAGAIEEMQRQNQELLRTLDALQARQDELAQLNRELDDTNRGVLALYAELDEKADFLRRASEMKTKFLSNMSHEFRTPLNSILSLTRLLLDRMDGEINSEQEKQVTFIRKAAEDLSELVNDLLDLAKVEAGKVVVKPSEFEASALCGALRGMLRPLLAHNSSVSLVFEDTDVPVLFTDESKVSQVLRNFISNALKFTEHGEVRVSAGVGPDDTVVFTVADTGIGIAPEDQERIFQEFTQVDNPRQSRFKGTGLGLPLSRKLAALLGGSVTVTSQPGVGSTFTLIIPRIYRGPGDSHTDVPDVGSVPDGIRWPVLVVEDNRETLFVYEKLLRGSGFQVVAARTMAEARRALARFRPVAVILDILLETENTWALLAELKAHEATRAIPVLVVTVLDNRERAIAAGADAFCAKPVDRAWLLDRLKEARQEEPDRLLIIDDDEVARYLLRGMLTDTRFQVIEATGARDGLDQARLHRPRAIFLDLTMPDLGGDRVLDYLKANDETQAIPVIIHTSKVLAAEERQRLEQVAVAILSKESPSREQAQACLREALTRAGLGNRGT